MLVAKVDFLKGPSIRWGLLLQPTTPICAPLSPSPPSPRTSSCFAAFLLLSAQPELHPERSHAFPSKIKEAWLPPLEGGHWAGTLKGRRWNLPIGCLVGGEKGGAGLELVPSLTLPPGDAVAKGNLMRGREDGDGNLVPSPVQLCS